MADATVESGPAPEYSKGEDQPPPTYNSLFGEIKEAKKNSSGHGEFLKTFATIIVGTVGFTIILGIFLAIPILAIVVGSLNLHNCPVQRYIPIWLIVAGACSAVQQIASMCKNVGDKHSSRGDDAAGEEKPANSGLVCFNSLFGCFNFAWFITGCVWVYSIYAPDTTNIHSTSYCDFTTYYLAFWLLTIVFIMMGLVIFCCCCISCCVAAASD